ncbi:Ribosomal lysine N-methyltransferase set10 [Neolecta irregularis DAH-3]|uniref:Ribosomal lysine N-methyltransferase set10 n=1 Tax=Neolecta irregularis (strain DAH-3) TaxID=1198029 RepID=A0A1U7LUW6_NEOID|nr:Ribosomal lysine N-methyltransferase set10 [Neolecta irregularis DAH-3]|eukprot:OLL26466.1 Ribosomal lysine N-methyltransferase set10 [Neolecta irregularis DAH-3]
MGYGFCVENNAFDSVILASPSITDDPLDEATIEKNKYLALNAQKWMKIQAKYLTHEIPFPEGLKMYWRILVANKEELERIQLSVMETDHIATLPGGLRNELNMLKYLEKALVLKVTTMLSHDFTLVESSSQRMRWIKMYRDGQASILGKALDETAKLRLDAVRSATNSSDNLQVSFGEALNCITVTPENAWYANDSVKNAINGLFTEPEVRLYMWLVYQKLYWPHLDETSRMIDRYWETALQWADGHVVGEMFESVRAEFAERHPEVFGSELTEEVFAWAVIVVENKGFEWIDSDSGEAKMVLMCE